MDPNWVAVGISAVGIVVSGFVAYNASLRGTAIALARFEERQKFQGETLQRLQNEQDAQSDFISDHSGRLRVLESALDIRPPPRDYSVRG